MNCMKLKHKLNNEKKSGPWNTTVVILNESTDILSKP